MPSRRHYGRLCFAKSKGNQTSGGMPTEGNCGDSTLQARRKSLVELIWDRHDEEAIVVGLRPFWCTNLSADLGDVPGTVEERFGVSQESD
jgi:hypothetical protein